MGYEFYKIEFFNHDYEWTFNFDHQFHISSFYLLFEFYRVLISLFVGNIEHQNPWFLVHCTSNVPLDFEDHLSLKCLDFDYYFLLKSLDFVFNFISVRWFCYFWVAIPSFRW